MFFYLIDSSLFGSNCILAEISAQFLYIYTKESTPGPYCVQENDIFLGWEKGTGKKWGKSKRKGGTDLSLEEMKKQAAVQCLRSASDEVRPLCKAKVFKSVCYHCLIAISVLF